VRKGTEHGSMVAKGWGLYSRVGVGQVVCHFVSCVDRLLAMLMHVLDCFDIAASLSHLPRVDRDLLLST
jgi:hypothetical protein